MKSPILFVETHRGIAESFAATIAEKVPYEMLGIVPSGIEAVRVCQSKKPALVVANMKLRDLDGIGLLHRLGEMDSPARVFFYTDSGNTRHIVMTARWGARGIYHEDDPIEELPQGVGRVLAGGLGFSTTPTRERMGLNGDSGGLFRMLPQRREVLVLLADGLIAKEIAAVLGRPVRTVEKDRDAIRSFFHAETVGEAVRAARERGIIA